MKYLKYFERNHLPNFSHYLFPVDEENNWMFDSFEYLLKLNTEPKIFDMKNLFSSDFSDKKYAIFDMKNLFLSDFSDKKYAIYFKYNKEIPDFIINRSISVTDKEFEKYNLTRNEEKEEEAKLYSANKKYNF